MQRGEHTDNIARPDHRLSSKHAGCDFGTIILVLSWRVSKADELYYDSACGKVNLAGLDLCEWGGMVFGVRVGIDM